jgi:hypothetical protein
MTLQKAGPESADSDGFCAASATRRFYLKIGFVGDHRHSRIRENVFALRLRIQPKSL